MTVVLLLAGFAACSLARCSSPTPSNGQARGSSSASARSGTLLAGVSTALPESAIPVLAVLR